MVVVIFIVVNAKYGGFDLSEEGQRVWEERSGRSWDEAEVFRHEFRTDPVLVSMVLEDPDRYSGSFARLRVDEIPDDVDWQIENIDGIECVSEKHRKWSYTEKASV